VNGDSAANLTTPVSLTSTATAASPVGSYPITASGASSANYTVAYVAGTMTVMPAALTITAINTNKVYGAAVPTLTASYNGFVNGDSAANLTTPVSLTSTATAASPVGSYPITASGAGSSNYTITYAGGTLAVTRASTAGIVSASANPSLPGLRVTFTCALSVPPPGAGTLGGTVRFRIDGKSSGPAVALSGGAASYSPTTLALGSHTVSAEYAGSTNFIGTTNTLTPAQLVNTPPVAGPDTITATNGSTISVAAATLLSNDTDADGDPLSFVGVSPTSAHNGTVTFGNKVIAYTPPPGLTNTDTFTYTISDGRGAPVTGTVTVLIHVDPVPPPRLALTALAGGALQLRLGGVPGRTYHVQYAEDMRNPVWQLVGSGTADGTGQFVFVDTPPPGTAHRFYRTVYP